MDEMIARGSIAELSGAMARSDITAEHLLQQYLYRIKKLDSRLNSEIALNPNAVADARALDNEAKSRGPLHGMPVH